MPDRDDNLRRNGWSAGIGLSVAHLLALPLLADWMDTGWFSAAFLVFLVVAVRRRLLHWLLPAAYSFVVLNHLFEPATAWGLLPWAIPAALFLVVWKSGLSLPRLFLLGGWMGLLAGAGIFSWVWRAGVVFLEVSHVAAWPLFLGVCLIAALPIALMLPLTGLLARRLGWPAGLCGSLVYAVVASWSPPGMSLNLALALPAFPLLLQPADIIGSHGVTALIALAAGLGVSAFELRQRSAARGAALCAGLAVLVVAGHLAYGAVAMRRHAKQPGEAAISVAVVQPLAPLKLRREDAALREGTARSNVELTREALEAGGVDFLLWPEGAGPFAAHTPSYNPEFMRGITELQQEFPVPLAVQCVEFTTDPEKGAVRYYNVATVIRPAGEPGPTYRKNILMPIGEYLPFEEQLPFLRRLFPEARTMLPGTEATPLEGPGGRFAPLICYEILFPGYVRGIAAQDAGYLVNFTNDRWYGRRQQPRQHLAFAVLRAVENRKPLVRPTNSGISVFIDPRGVIDRGNQLPTGEAGILRGTIEPRLTRSLYSRIGNPVHPWVLTPLLAGLVGYVCLPRRGRQRSSAEAAPDAGSGPAVKRSRRGRRRRD